ncbi:MAG: carbamoyl-phosphate synthase large subunit [bacterium]|nr:carbamoyl-phosphate synthase large subunit [bacterium]
MPKRTDIKKILIIGSGPIVIGQACEFDYSGTQGCKALREEGYEVVLVNSNPATIMTDPQMGDRTYIEPITADIIAKIIERERPHALLPTLGGQTGLNVSLELYENGILEQFNVELIGAKAEAIKKAEDRSLFKKCMENIGLKVPKSGLAYTVEDALQLVKDIGYPNIIRPAFTLGGSGGSIAYDETDFLEKVQWGLATSPIHQVLIEQSVIGWKEFELEVMRDIADNVVIICSIENFDPMGIHTGDSITVAPAQTLSDKEYQQMRDAAIAIIREIGVETGGSNIQFAVNPVNGDMVAIEMNPRVSRSSALASKATGFPIAKIAAKLAVGYRLDEIPNDITKKTPACFEPTIDYCVVKIPRFAFEKFPGAEPILNTQMKSVGETMSIGRTFKEALQKGIRSLEIGRFGFGGDGRGTIEIEKIVDKLRIPNPERLFYIHYALSQRMSIEKIHKFTNIDPWFLANLKQIVEMERKLAKYRLPNNSNSAQEIKEQKVPIISSELLREAKRYGFSDVQLAYLLRSDEETIRQFRKKKRIVPTFKVVDTCAAEFEAYTPYYYSTYETESEVKKSDKKKVIIIGGGPNRIGQGIEFDYCCVHGVQALREEGYEAIMVNSNPETVSTDYDISDRLYFEPLTREDVLNIIEAEQPEGVIVQFGGQTPLNLAIPLAKAGVNILGTSPDSIDLAEDRKRFGALLTALDIPTPENGTARSIDEAIAVATRIGYPVIVRPSYVLGGRAMEIVYEEIALRKYIERAVMASEEHPVLIDRFLENAVEIDVDAISDGNRTVIGAIMEHIEEAGIHSGDSACVIPPRSLNSLIIDTVKEYTYKLAKALKVVGLMNIQYALKDGKVYVLEVNPRASRTIPYVSKAIGIPLAKYATKIMVGKTLEELGFTQEKHLDYFAVKEVVLPFIKFPGVDIILGPEMKSTGEVMGLDTRFGAAFAKSQIAAGSSLPKSGTVFISVNDPDKPAIVPIARKLVELGFYLRATRGTYHYLQAQGIPVDFVYKVNEGSPNVVDLIHEGKINLIINTPLGKISKYDEFAIRRTAITNRIPVITTIPAAFAAVEGIQALQQEELYVRSLQEYHST